MCLFLFAAEDSSSNGLCGESSGFEDVAAFPPPPLPTEISLLELPPKIAPHPAAEVFRVRELEIWPSVLSLPPVQMDSVVGRADKERGSVITGQPTEQKSPPTETTPPQPPLPPPPPLPQSDPMTDEKSPTQMAPDSPPPPGKLSPSPGKDGPPMPTKPKPKL